MRKIFIYTILLTLLFAAFSQVVFGQNQPPVFTKFVRGGVEMDMSNLSLEMREGDMDTIQIFAIDPNGDDVFITAKGLNSSWSYFMSASGAGSATLHFAPDYDSQGNHTVVFEAFDKDLSQSASSATLSLHIIDRNTIGAGDNELMIMNYPNPFKTTTTLEFVVPKGGVADLKIYTASGHEIISIINGVLTTPARYFRKIDLTNYPAGTYIYRLKVDGVGEVSGRMIKL